MTPLKVKQAISYNVDAKFHTTNVILEISRVGTQGAIPSSAIIEGYTQSKTDSFFITGCVMAGDSSNSVKVTAIKLNSDGSYGGTTYTWTYPTGSSGMGTTSLGIGSVESRDGVCILKTSNKSYSYPKVFIDLYNKKISGAFADSNIGVICVTPSYIISGPESWSGSNRSIYCQSRSATSGMSYTTYITQNNNSGPWVINSIRELPSNNIFLYTRSGNDSSGYTYTLYYATPPSATTNAIGSISNVKYCSNIFVVGSYAYLIITTTSNVHDVYRISTSSLSKVYSNRPYYTTGSSHFYERKDYLLNYSGDDVKIISKSNFSVITTLSGYGSNKRHDILNNVLLYDGGFYDIASGKTYITQESINQYNGIANYGMSLINGPNSIISKNNCYAVGPN